MSSDTIRRLFVLKLRAISSLTTLLGGTSHIIEYVEEEEGDIFTTIANLRPNHLLVAYQGTEPSGERGCWAHHYSLFFKPGGSPSVIFSAIVDGVPAGESLKMFLLPLTPGLHPMDNPSLSRRRTPVGDFTGYDYWEITTAFVQNTTA